MIRALAARAAWISVPLCALSVLFSVGAMFFAVLNRYSSFELIDEAIGPLAAVSFSVVGALIASRRPENPIGWIFCFTGLTQGLVTFAYTYAEYALVTAPGSLPFGPLMSWVGQLVWYPGLSMMLTFGLLLFPDGRLPGRRWRFVAWVCVTPLAIFVVGAALAWPDRGRSFLYSEESQPEGLVLLVDSLLFPLLLVCALVCVASLFVRFRRSGGVERQQLKWFAYASAATLLMLFVSNSLSFGIISTLLLLPFIPSIPAAVGLAIFRFRLYDVDVIINRTLVYIALTAALVLVYLGSVVSLQYLFRTFAGGDSQLAVVASTLAIAALFNPLRRRVQGFVDRRFYRGKYDAGRILAAFSARLRDETDLDRLSGEAIGVVRETLQPAHASLWLVSSHERAVAKEPVG